MPALKGYRDKLQTIAQIVCCQKTASLARKIKGLRIRERSVQSFVCSTAACVAMYICWKQARCERGTLII